MQRFVAALMAGNYVETAAAQAGLAKRTVYEWMRRGARGQGKEYVDFLHAVQKAQAHAETRAVALISRAAESQWQAAAWQLERKCPARWGQRIRVTVDHEQAAFLDRLERELPRAVYEQVLAVVAGTPGEGTLGTPAIAEGESADSAAAGAEPARLHSAGEPALSGAETPDDGGDEV
jgi:hypothetical protein